MPISQAIGPGVARFGGHGFGWLSRALAFAARLRRGFAIYVGGGLAAVPQQAKVLREFVPEEEIMPISQAIGRVFARLGEKRNRNQARLKFLVSKLGIDEFRRLVFEERAVLPHDDKWSGYLADVRKYEEPPLNLPFLLDEDARTEEFDRWYATNVYHQRQAGYATVT